MIMAQEIKGLCRRTWSTHASQLVSCSLPINNNNSNIKITLAVHLLGELRIKEESNEKNRIF